VPAHPLALRLLTACGLPIAAPSANRFAHVSPTRARHVLADLGMKNVRVLEGDEETSELGEASVESATCKHGIESTVLRVHAEDRTLQIFRQGAVTKDDIESLLSSHNMLLSSSGTQSLIEGNGNTFNQWKVDIVNRVVQMHGTAPGLEHPGKESSSGNIVGEIAPGQAVTHYSPDIPCYIVSSVRNCLRTPSSRAEEAVLDLDSASVSKDTTNAASFVHVSHGTVLQSRQSTLSQHGIVIIDFAQRLQALESFALVYRDLSPSGSSVEGARNLFDYLRWAESVPGAQMVLVSKLTADSSGLSAVDVSVLTDGADGQQLASVRAKPSEDNKLMSGLRDRLFRSASGVEVVLSLVQ
jgi:L-threonylcarbamoyladenylate synthase